MRLRTFVAGTMSEVMQEVRAVLGEEAIIVSTSTQDDGRVRVTAALEHEDFNLLDEQIEPVAADRASQSMDALGQALAYHGVPLDLCGRLLGLAACIEMEDPVMRLAAVLDDLFGFSPIHSGAPKRPLMLIGPPGMGKTVTTAKLAARATMSGGHVSVINIDTTRAGASDQLSAFARIMGIEMKTAETPTELRFAMRSCGEDSPVLIDSDGINPFDNGEMARLVQFVEIAEVDTALVMAAGTDPLEAADIAEAFRVLRPDILITTRIDMARRLGGMITSAETGCLAFGEVGIAPQIANGLAPLNPVSLARLLMRDPLRLELEFQNPEAAE